MGLTGFEGGKLKPLCDVRVVVPSNRVDQIEDTHLALQQPHGELVADDERGPAHWTLDALAEAAQAHGISIQRSQVRRFLSLPARAGVRLVPGPSATIRRLAQ